MREKIGRNSDQESTKKQARERFRKHRAETRRKTGMTFRERMQKIRKGIFGKIHQSWFVVALCMGVIIGMILGQIYRIAFFDSAVWVAVVVVIFMVCYFQPRAFLIIVVAGAGMILAFYRCSSELAGQDYIKQFVGRKVTVAGTIDGDPETDESGTKFKLKDLMFGEVGAVDAEVVDGNGGSGEASEETNEKEKSGEVGENERSGEVGEEMSGERGGGARDEMGQKAQAVKGNLYISMSRNEELAREDQVVLTGEMKEGFGTYAGFLSRPEIVNWARPSPGDWVLNVRNWFAGRVRNVIPEEEANLGLSYLLGMKTGLSEELEEDLRTVGLTHVVVASGAHLSILVEAARKIFGRASRFVGVGASLIFVGFFMALVGWTPSIMRAGIMSGLSILVGAVGREFAPWRIILLTMAITLMINPMFLTNLGWLLSFASFAGIMILGPMITRFFYGERRPGMIASTVLTTLSATVLTLPITLYYFGTVSLISFVANLLILPTLPYAMGLTFLSGVFSRVPGIETAVGFVATKMLDFHTGVMGFFGQMKSFLVEIPTEQVGVFALYAVILVLVGLGWMWQKWRRRRLEAELGVDVGAELEADAGAEELGADG